MKIIFSIRRLVPRFLYQDKNGHALCKAIERAFELAAEAAEQGLSVIQDPDEMPEWRLDEMAWELNCLYDYTADIETKRYWIKNAVWHFMAYGTPQLIQDYLEGKYAAVQVKESWDYDGEPFHFRVIARDTNQNGGSAEWAMKAIEQTKNVRSILDALEILIPDAESALHTGGVMSLMPRLPIPQTSDALDFKRNVRIGDTMSIMPRLPIPQTADAYRFTKTVRAGGAMQKVSRLAIHEIPTPEN